MAKLRRVDALTSQGEHFADALGAMGTAEVSYFRRRREFGGLKSDQKETDA